MFQDYNTFNSYGNTDFGVKISLYNRHTTMQADIAMSSRPGRPTRLRNAWINWSILYRPIISILTLHIQKLVYTICYPRHDGLIVGQIAIPRPTVTLTNSLLYHGQYEYLQPYESHLPP